MKKILLCGLKYDLNYGDPIINDTVKYIIEDITKDKEIEIEDIDISGRNGYKQYYKIKNQLNRNIRNIFFRGMLKLLNSTKKRNSFLNWLDYISWFFSDEYIIAKQEFMTKIEHSDAVIFGGGGIMKYKYQYFYHYINFVTKFADKYQKPVYLNAVGVEGYDITNIKSRVLKKAVNRACVKQITTRDDYDKLVKYVTEKRIDIAKVSDPATYTNVAYQIEKNETSDIIGLGIARANLFIDNELPFTEKQQIEFWCNVIKALESKKIKWKLFTNGLPGDNEMLYKIQKKINCKENQIMIPKTPEELITIISNFKGIIATRLHSNIVAYSLGVPSIGLVWNKKLKMFGESINYPERFIELQDFDVENVVKKLENAMIEQYEKCDVTEYRKTVYKKMEQFLYKYVLEGKE